MFGISSPINLALYKAPILAKTKRIKKDRIVIKIVQKIIIEGVSSQITFNIININNSKEMQDIVKRIYLEVDQKILYFILQEILNYRCIYKPKEYDKPAIKIFVKVYFFCK